MASKPTLSPKQQPKIQPLRFQHIVRVGEYIVTVKKHDSGDGYDTTIQRANVGTTAKADTKKKKKK